ncbi:MAG: metal-dependent transcriptional regulator [Chloroflexaceae bacterium]|jgi:DtxR family Mn-dependent transcriptional regulator|nr:metal-dependent transcriptional regulator [Chloroflexaceae bacterium]
MSHSTNHARASVRRSPNSQEPTPVERAYLEVIYDLAWREEPVIAARLARWLRVSAPTVTDMVQRMERKGYITRDRHNAITFTTPGQALAEQVVRRHRLVERFLYDVLGIPWHLVHQEAVRLEPVLSPMMEERIEALVGTATACPHGNPIPGSHVARRGMLRLDQVSRDTEFLLTRVDEEAGEDPCLFQWLWMRGLVPDTTITRLDDSPEGMVVQVGPRRYEVAEPVARMLWGEQLGPASGR